MEAKIKEFKDIIATIPLNGRGFRTWQCAPDKVAQLVKMCAGMTSRERNMVVAAADVTPSAIHYMCLGLDSNGSKVWPELRSELERIGAPYKQGQPRYHAGSGHTVVPPSAKRRDVTERARVSAVRLLDRHFKVEDSGSGVYEDGWSDDRIAKETGLSHHVIWRMRTSSFGKIIDPRVAKVHGEVAALMAELSEVRTRLADLEAKVLSIKI